MGRIHIAKVGPEQQMYQNDKHGLVWIENEATASYHACHPYVSSKDEVIRRIKQKDWKKKERFVGQNRRYYNVDRREMNDQWDRIAAGYCKCKTCEERRNPHELC